MEPIGDPTPGPPHGADQRPGAGQQPHEGAKAPGKARQAAGLAIRAAASRAPASSKAAQPPGPARPTTRKPGPGPSTHGGTEKAGKTAERIQFAASAGRAAVHAAAGDVGGAVVHAGKALAQNPKGRKVLAAAAILVMLPGLLIGAALSSGLNASQAASMTASAQDTLSVNVLRSLGASRDVASILQDAAAGTSVPWQILAGAYVTCTTDTLNPTADPGAKTVPAPAGTKYSLGVDAGKAKEANVDPTDLHAAAKWVIAQIEDRPGSSPTATPSASATSGPSAGPSSSPSDGAPADDANPPDFTRASLLAGQARVTDPATGQMTNMYQPAASLAQGQASQADVDAAAKAAQASKDAWLPAIKRMPMSGGVDDAKAEGIYAKALQIAQGYTGPCAGSDAAIAAATPGDGSAPKLTGTEHHYSLGAVKPQTQALADFLGTKFGVKTIGGVRPDSYPDHPSGLAADLMVYADKAKGDAINDYVKKWHEALGVKYTIWQQTYWTPGRDPKKMADRGSPTANHMDHVHVTLLPDVTGISGTENQPAPSGTPDPAITPEASTAPSASPAPTATASASPSASPGDATDAQDQPDTGSLPKVDGLSSEQVANANAIALVASELKVPDQGLIVAYMTALQESSLQMYANDGANARGYKFGGRGNSYWLGVARLSLAYPHQAVGHDADSVNIFQQRASAGWGGETSKDGAALMKNLMDPQWAAKAFFGGPGKPIANRGLLDISGWESMAPGKAAQTVQGSAFPDAYDKWEPLARKLAAALGHGVAVASQCPTVTQLLGGGTGTYPAGKPGPWGGYQNGLIPLSALKEIPWARGQYMRPDAEAALEKLNAAYKDEFGTDMTINDSYRSYERQVAMKAAKGAFAATPGKSFHGWGMAVDLGGGIGQWGTPQREWMVKNAPGFGILSPDWAQPGQATPEAWHWEYWGVSTTPPAGK